MHMRCVCDFSLLLVCVVINFIIYFDSRYYMNRTAASFNNVFTVRDTHLILILAESDLLKLRTPWNIGLKVSV